MELVEREQLRTDLPDFRVGDTVKVHVKIVEGEKERIQLFEGVVIRKKRGGIRSTFTVRKISYGIGVEPQDRPNRYPQPGEGEKGQTLLSEGAKGEGGPYSRRKESRSLVPHFKLQIVNCNLKIYDALPRPTHPADGPFRKDVL